jgi:hypothetical protein
MISLYQIIKDSVSWSFGHKREAAEIVLVLALIFVGWRYNKKSAELEKTTLEHSQLAAGLRQQIQIRDGQILILNRDGSKTNVKKKYVPPEGSVIISEKDFNDMRTRYDNLNAKLGGTTNPAEKAFLEAEILRLKNELNNPDTSVVINDIGFTVKPGFGAEWSGMGINPRLDFKWFYLQRYSLIVGGSKGGADIGASRHLDDILYGSPGNIELFGGWKFFRMPGYRAVVFGIRSNF